MKLWNNEVKKNLATASARNRPTVPVLIIVNACVPCVDVLLRLLSLSLLLQRQPVTGLSHFYWITVAVSIIY